MSVFVRQCDPVDFLVTAAMLYRVRAGTGGDQGPDPDGLGRMLLRGHVASGFCDGAHHRDQCDDDGHRALYQGYTWTPVPEGEVDPLAVVAACRAIVRESNDYPCRAAEETAAFLNRLERAATALLPQVGPHCSGAMPANTIVS